MSGYQGDFAVDSTVYVPFATYDSNDPAASVTLTGLAVTDIEIYKNGSVTQRSSDAGYTLLDTDGIDFDGTTGIHGFSIDLSDNTDAGFYAAGGEYFVVVASVTVDAGVVNFIAATFSIERTGGALAQLKAMLDGNNRVDVGSWLGTAVTVSATTALPEVDAKSISDDATAANNAEAFFDGTGYAGTNNVMPTVTTLSGHTAQTGDTYALANGATGFAAIDTVVDTINGNVGTNGAALTDLGGMSTGMKAEINVEAKDVLFTDTDAEPGQGAPAATATLAAKIGYLYKAWRNRSTQDATTYSLYNDDATTVDHKATVSDNGTTADKGEIATGP